MTPEPETNGETGPVTVREHRCSECPDCGPGPRLVECAADGCEGIATTAYPYCTDECAEGRCPNCGQPRTAMVCAPDECKP
jgi:hypothetical protein